MANRTVKEAISVKGTNPQYLVEKIIRTRIYDCKYWKEECFALTAEFMVDKAMELRYVGGVYGGNIKPTPFLCLTLKMLQIQPEKDIVIEFIKNEDFKYVRALGAFYMRLVGSSVECYKYLEPLYNDYRKIRIQNKDGNFELLYMDDFIDHLLRDERYCDVILPRLQKRQILEEANELEPRVSALEEDLDETESETEEEGERKGGSVSPPIAIAASRMRGRERERSREKERSRGGGHERERSRDRKKDRERRSRERQRSRERERTTRRRSRSRSHERRRDERDRKVRRERSAERSRRDRSTRDRRDRSEEKTSKKDSKNFSEKEKSRKEDSEKYAKKKDGKKGSGAAASSALDQEIAEANAIRSKLGLAPLRP